MVKTAQSKIGLTTLFVVILGFIPNSDVVQSRGHGAQTELSDLLDRASKRVEEYRLLFKDLTAEETKTTEVFNRRGEVTEKKVVLSDFFVYQSRFNDQAMYEYRPARSINAKPVANREENVQKFFNKLARADTAEKEGEILFEENRKGHLRYWYFHLTLNPAGVFYKQSQRYYDFEIIGREEIEGRETVIVGYTRKDPGPLNPRELIGKRMSSDFKSGILRHRGRYWLDAETARMLRNESEAILEFDDKIGRAHV